MACHEIPVDQRLRTRGTSPSDTRKVVPRPSQWLVMIFRVQTDAYESVFPPYILS